MLEDTVEVKDVIDRVRNRRRDAMLAAAYLALLGIVYVIVYEQINLTEYSQGVITMIAGALIGFLTMMHNFEYGATRSSAAKDTAIADMSKTAAVTANTAQTLATGSVISAAQQATAPGAGATINTSGAVINAGDVTLNNQGDLNAAK